MKINNLNTTQNNKTVKPAFGWQPLCRGNVIKPLLNGRKATIPVDICLLGAEDAPMIRTFASKDIFQKTTYGKMIAKDFLDGVTNRHQYIDSNSRLCYLAIRPRKCKEHQSEMPIAFAQVAFSSDFKKMELCALQTSGNILSLPKDKRIEGCGQMIMYGISRLLLSTQTSALRIFSSNDAFYEKHFKVVKYPLFDDLSKLDIYRSSLKNFINTTSQKFKLTPQSITFSQKTLEKIKQYSFKDIYNH